FVTLAEEYSNIQIRIKLLNYDNKNGLKADGQCCRLSNCDDIDVCRFKFYFALTESYTLLKDDMKQTQYTLGPTEELLNYIDFRKELLYREDLEIDFKMHFKLMNSIILTIGVFNINNEDENEVVDNLFLDLTPFVWLNRPMEDHILAAYGLRNETSHLQFVMETKCQDNYYGPKCKIYCKDVNDVSGHYNCDANGSKICLDNWNGENCNSQTDKICPFYNQEFLCNRWQIDLLIDSSGSVQEYGDDISKSWGYYQQLARQIVTTLPSRKPSVQWALSAFGTKLDIVKSFSEYDHKNILISTAIEEVIFLNEETNIGLALNETRYNIFGNFKYDYSPDPHKNIVLNESIPNVLIIITDGEKPYDIEKANREADIIKMNQNLIVIVIKSTIFDLHPNGYPVFWKNLATDPSLVISFDSLEDFAQSENVKKEIQKIFNRICGIDNSLNPVNSRLIFEKYISKISTIIFNPCQNNGQCLRYSDRSDDTKCACPGDYYGEFCSHHVCKDNPCINGTCQPNNGTYQCICNFGFFGRHCSITRDDINFCQNIEKCDMTKCRITAYGYFDCECNLEGYEIANYGCRLPCPDNFYGLKCDIYCIPSDTCDGHYKCDGNSGEKICLESWTGENCEIKTPDYQNSKDLDKHCSENTICFNGGYCYDQGCCCRDNFKGEYCEIYLKICKDDTCKNNGVCIELQSQYYCKCLPGWIGKNCEKINPDTEKEILIEKEQVGAEQLQKSILQLLNL
ncbi:hypothetical protein A3Q56_05849, partial [Intoshia linei]